MRNRGTQANLVPPERYECSSDVSTHASASRGGEISHGLQRGASGLGACTNCGPEWMLRALFQGSGDRQQFGRLHICDGDHFCDNWVPLGERSSLVDHQRADLARVLERRGVTHQNSRLRATPAAYHDRGGRRQTQGAWAGDYEHSHCVDQRRGECSAERPPQSERSQCEQHYHGYENAGHAVGKPLNRCFGTLRLAHETQDLRHLRCASHFGSAQAQETLADSAFLRTPVHPDVLKPAGFPPSACFRRRSNSRR